MNQSWRNTLEYVKQRVSPSDYEAWIQPLAFTQTGRQHGELAVANQQARDKIHDSYLNIILDGLLLETGTKFKLEVTVDDANQAPVPAGARAPDTVTKPPLYRRNNRYTFDNFVVGSSNQFAHAACYNVAQSPGHNYNPLFIYGGVGLGKTHLLNAIGTSIQQAHEDWRIYYLSSEQFMNELIQSLQFEDMIQFRRRYRESCDVLLVDDIQFLSGKDRTQEEFFHTFNTLYEAGKQIVVTSDLFPQ